MHAMGCAHHDPGKAHRFEGENTQEGGDRMIEPNISEEYYQDVNEDEPPDEQAQKVRAFHGA